MNDMVAKEYAEQVPSGELARSDVVYPTPWCLPPSDRKNPVAIMADIESMFHQVRVPREDADLLRFLWWPNSDFTQDLVDFRILV